MRHFVVCLFVARLAQAATCPPPPIPSVVEGDLSYDRERTREVLGTLAGGALEELGDDRRLVSHATAVLWTRRWQLQCAVEAGRVRAPDPILREIAAQAAELLDPTGLHAPHPPADLDWHAVVLRPALPPIIPRPRPYYVGGGIALGVGALFLSGAIALAVDTAQWRPPPPCGSAWLCFNDLDYAVHDLQIGIATGLGVIGLAATITGIVCLERGVHYSRERRIQPTANGLRITF